MSPEDSDQISGKVNQITQTIDEIGKEASRVEGEAEEKRADRCISVNTGVMTRLHKQGVPGVVYTVESNRDEASLRFSETGWTKHAIGIVRVQDDLYLAYDQTNTQTKNSAEDPSYFTATGTLTELSQKLGERFGSVWNLEWGQDDPTANPTLVVSKKIDAIEEQLRQDRKPTDLHIRFNPPPGINPESPIWNKLRGHLTSTRP